MMGRVMRWTLLAVCLGMSSLSALAQDMAAEKAAQDTAEQTAPTAQEPTQESEPMPPEPATEAPTEPAAQPTTEAADAPATQAAASENYIWFLLRGGGPIGFIIILQSIATVALTVKYLMEIRREKLIPPRLVADFENRLREKKYQEAYETAKVNPSFLGRVLAAGLAKISTGYPQAVEAMHEVGEDESMKLEHKLSWLAMMGTTGPLLGLFGTVVGMVDSFRVIATSETQPKPSQLADGISVALITTLEGMVVAIIATVAFMLLKNQAARLVLEVGMVSENLMSRFSNLSRPARSATAME